MSNYVVFVVRLDNMTLMSYKWCKKASSLSSGTSNVLATQQPSLSSWNQQWLQTWLVGHSKPESNNARSVTNARDMHASVRPSGHSSGCPSSNDINGNQTIDRTTCTGSWDCCQERKYGRMDGWTAAQTDSPIDGQTGKLRFISET